MAKLDHIDMDILWALYMQPRSFIELRMFLQLNPGMKEKDLESRLGHLQDIKLAYLEDDVEFRLDPEEPQCWCIDRDRGEFVVENLVFDTSKIPERDQR